jgi:hypothetical protein
MNKKIFYLFVCGLLVLNVTTISGCVKEEIKATTTPLSTISLTPPDGSSKENPIPMRESLVTPEGVEITVLDAIKGDLAWEILQNVTTVNRSPEKGMQYVLITVKVKGTSVHLDPSLFDFKLDDGSRIYTKYDRTVIAPNDGTLGGFGTSYHGDVTISHLSFYILRNEAELVLVWEHMEPSQRFFEVKASGSLTVPTTTLATTPATTPTITPLPLEAPGWEGVTVSRLCLKVEESYPEIEGKFTQDIDKTIQHILEDIGVKVVGEGEPCDATLTFTVTCHAWSAFYIPGGKLYTGAQAIGQMELTGEGRKPVSLYGSDSYPCPSATSYTADDRREKPEGAPFDSVWPYALLKCLSGIWGPRILIEGWHGGSAANELLREFGWEAVDLLVQALRNEDSNIRRAAAEALDEFGWAPKSDIEEAWYLIAATSLDKPDMFVNLGEEAVELFIQALNDEDYNVREYAANALGEIKNDRAIEPLIQALKDEETNVRAAAREALVKIGTAAVEPLTQALEDEDWLVRRNAELALEEIRGNN